MRALLHLSILLPLLAGCGEKFCPGGTSGNASLEVTPVSARAEHVDLSSFEVTVTSDVGSETQTVELDHAASFEVSAGDVHVAAVGSWSHVGGDTGGEGCDCHGEQDLVLCSGATEQIALSLVCDECWID
ncbi:MAG: hypothetical protein ABIO70_35055 [Pseudomonadota bacterium]